MLLNTGNMTAHKNEKGMLHTMKK